MAFKQNDLFFAMTGGGPGSETRDGVVHAEQDRVRPLLYGEASALAVILLLIITGLSMIFVRYLLGITKKD